ncbi:hypothetical protein A2415_05565 [candidate division WWE3 bacterium RIFOXYC1_FULL_39_7]|uniref:Glycosyl transferase n=2 Tax=Katanobacteria TaxID=422282 RepID=A0A1F4X893_UNCKA|nr:MAG: hypothetical protein A2415_05565 [candidate division WWE3 bacterium RIFOXYC1_FULL_39_7]OGC77882.1 MAG: hypothetical protein A2619_03705 [candidate division WWE3 bacterium RIFOXYD1_FULL_39_9]
MKKRYLVTFYDSNYLPKAVATYLSLQKYHSNFVLYAFCFDDLSYEITKKLNYPNFIPIAPKDFENEELKKSKSEKEKLYEYYWSCKPYIVLKVMNDTKADMVTYIDCDFMFFDNPEVIFQEIGNADVLIQPNNFSVDEVDQFKPVGYYCSCWESFKNTKNARQVLGWWHQKCMEWCYARFEDGKFADQKYLDQWRILFKGVRENTQIGANIAPWSIQKYDLSSKNGKVIVNGWPLIYYHYHSFRMNLINYKYIITGDRENFYRIPKEAVSLVYSPYIKLLKQTLIDLKKIPEYYKYAISNPESLIKVKDTKAKAVFTSYKDAVTSTDKF